MVSPTTFTPEYARHATVEVGPLDGLREDAAIGGPAAARLIVRLQEYSVGGAQV